VKSAAPSPFARRQRERKGHRFCDPQSRGEGGEVGRLRVNIRGRGFFFHGRGNPKEGAPEWGVTRFSHGKKKGEPFLAPREKEEREGTGLLIRGFGGGDPFILIIRKKGGIEFPRGDRFSDDYRSSGEGGGKTFRSGKKKKRDIS